ncbi:alpha/beta hydrolase [Aeoliella sp.]|uniref:alpha/beta hydrolase n=1 Tax=Aeoliella sp. TaxID=2795800 RepID=UPI003CCB93C6
MLRFKTLLAGCLLVCTAVAVQAKEAYTTRSVVYKKVGDRELELILSEPTAKSDEPRPAIVYIHGGGWSGGSHKSFADRLKRYVPRGIVFAQVEYRLIGRKPNDPPVPCIEDAKSAMRWVRSHADELNIDPDKILATGSSAGGHLSAAVTLLEGVDAAEDDLDVSPKANALVLFCPVLDNGPKDGYGHERCGPNWKDYSPAHHVTEGLPPTLILAGRDDPTAKLAAMERFTEAMQEAGNDCELLVLEGGHGFMRSKDHPENYQKTVEAFDDFLIKHGWMEKE